MRRFLCVALAFAFALAPLGATAADSAPDLATLRAKMRAATGPAPDNYRDVVTATGDDGGVTTFTLYKYGQNVRTTVDSGPIHTESGTIGGERWNQNANGITVAEEPDPSAIRASLDDDTITNDSATVRSNGTLSDGLIVSDIGTAGDGTRRFIDPNTFQMMRSERVRNGETTATTTIDDYAAFGAQTLPAHWTVVRASGGTVKYTRVERVPNSVSAAQVIEPGIRRLLVDFPADKPVEIPSHYRAGQFYVRATIAGRPVDFKLDTGSAGIAIDTDAAKRLGLKLINHRIVVNAQAADVYSAVVPSITLGPVAMHDIVVSTAPIKFKDTWSSDVVGLLGFDFLATIGLTVDNEHQRLIATPLDVYQPPAGPNVVPVDIRLNTHVPTVSVGLDNVVADRFVVDTGNGFGSYLVFDYFMNRHPNVGERSGQTIAGHGVGGDFTARSFFVHSFRLATYNFQDFNGFRVGGGSYPQPEDGSLGTLFLVLFNIDFDYAHGRMYLTPTTNTKQMLHMH